MGFDPFSRLTNNQSTIRLVLLGIILLTIPCYCLGAILLATAPTSESAENTPRPTLGGFTASPNRTPSNTPFITSTNTPPGAPLQPTPLQLYLRTTIAPFVYPTATLTMTPTNTPWPTATIAPTLTPTPTNTLPPSSTPTTAPLPTDTPTYTPTPTDTPTEEAFPTPTQEVALSS